MHIHGDDDRPLRLVLIVAGFLVILTGLRVSAPIVGPVLQGIRGAVLFDILMLWLEEKGLPHWIALTLAMISFLAVVAGFFLVVLVSFLQLVAQLPENQAAIHGSIASIASQLGLQAPSLSGELSVILSISVSAFAEIALSLMSVAMIVITGLFFLVEACEFSRKTVNGLAESPDVLERVSVLGTKVVRHIVIGTEVNLVIRVAIALLLAAVGVEYAAFWGFIAFALGFITYLRFLMAVMPPALIILAGTVIINTFVENVLFPQAAGKGLKVSPPSSSSRSSPGISSSAASGHCSPCP